MCLPPDWFQQRLLLTCVVHAWGQRRREGEGGREGGTAFLLTGSVGIRGEKTQICRELGLWVLLLEEHRLVG